MSRLSHGSSRPTPPELRIYRGPEDEAVEGPTHKQRTVTVRAGLVLPLLADALTSQRTWLEDFEEDEITLTADLYEVLMAYQHFRRPAG